MSAYYKYYLAYKPYGMLSQFREDHPGDMTLAHLDFDFEPDVYPVGRLDKDSEGLLLLTNDKELTAALLDVRRGHPRRYWVQIDDIPEEGDLEILRQGVDIRVTKRLYHTLPAKVDIIPEPPIIYPRFPPIQSAWHKQPTWLQIELREGKNRQIRRMTAAVGYPTLRLIRHAIGDIHIGEIEPGQVCEMNPEDRFLLLAT